MSGQTAALAAPSNPRNPARSRTIPTEEALRRDSGTREKGSASQEVSTTFAGAKTIQRENNRRDSKRGLTLALWSRRARPIAHGRGWHASCLSRRMSVLLSWIPDDRPRERLGAQGAQSLVGRRAGGAPARQRPARPQRRRDGRQRSWRRVGGLRGLAQAAVAELRKQPGIGAARASRDPGRPGARPAGGRQPSGTRTPAGDRQRRLGPLPGPAGLRPLGGVLGDRPRRAPPAAVRGLHRPRLAHRGRGPPARGVPAAHPRGGGGGALLPQPPVGRSLALAPGPRAHRAGSRRSASCAGSRSSITWWSAAEGYASLAERGWM